MTINSFNVHKYLQFLPSWWNIECLTNDETVLMLAHRLGMSYHDIMYHDHMPAYLMSRANLTADRLRLTGYLHTEDMFEFIMEFKTNV